MSKAITIQQKGVAQNITVDKLQVHKAGGAAYWVPEDTVELHALTATANGEYSAASAGKYGYGYASVSVPGSSVTGTGSDGNQHVITTDGSGAIVDTKVPSEIRIITPPDYVGPYGDGAYISFEGLTVEAFYADGTSAGMIDPQDLSFPVTVARYDGSAEPLVYDMTSDLISDAIPCSPMARAVWDEAEQTVWNYHFIGDGAASGKMTGWGGAAHSADRVIVLFASPIQGAQVSNDVTPEITLDSSYTHNGQTVYYTTSTLLGAWDVVPNIGEAPDQGDAAWTMIYGSLTGTSGGVQIPVQYQRPADGLVLGDSFGISVVPGPSGGDD